MIIGKYTAGVYILIKDMDVVYIGQSIQMELRLKSHEIDFDHYVLIPSKNRKRLEADLISLIQPKMNKMHTTMYKPGMGHFRKLEKQLVE